MVRCKSTLDSTFRLMFFPMKLGKKVVMETSLFRLGCWCARLFEAKKPLYMVDNHFMLGSSRYSAVVADDLVSGFFAG